MNLSDELLLTLKKEYGLKENHVLILKSLELNDLNADDICAKTKIPKGRIYEFLNFLVHTQLITKEIGSPARYSIKNINERLIDFAENHLNQELQKRSKLISLVDKGQTQDEFKVFVTPEESKIETRKAWVESKNLKIIFRGPYIPYILIIPKEIDHLYNKFLKISNKHKLFLRILPTEKPNEKNTRRNTFIKPIHDKKLFCTYLLDEESTRKIFSIWKKEFTQKEFKDIINNIKKQIVENKNFNLRIIKHPSEYNIRICDNKKVHIMLREYVYLTISTENKKVVNSYIKLFDKMYAKSTSFNDFLKEFN